MLRSAWVLVASFFVTLGYAIKLSALLSFGKADPLCGRCDSVARKWSRSILGIAGVSVVIEGTENLDSSVSCVVVANHESWFDVWALMAWLPINGKFVAKYELTAIPLFGSFLRDCGHVAIDRMNRDTAVRSMRTIVERMNKKILQVIIFAEGTRSADGELQPFKKGPFVLAIEAGVPVVPVSIIGSREIMPKGSFLVSRGEITVRVGEPISVVGLVYEDRDHLREIAQAAVAELKGRQKV